MPWKNHNPINLMYNYYRKVSDWGIDIPTTDDFAYTYPAFKNYKKFYNKMHICETQDIPHGPIGTEPTQYPLVMKPIINLYGGGVGSFVVHNKEQYDTVNFPGLFWSPYEIGEHYSFDLIVCNGVVVDHYCMRGEKLQHGMFDYWELVESSEQTFKTLYNWVENNFSGYTGCLNVEVINDTIIECHLRMGDIDRFGDEELMEAIHVLYNVGKWTYDGQRTTDFYMAALFSQYGQSFSINTNLCDEVFDYLIHYQIDNPDFYAVNPPTGQRLAIFCGTSLEEVTDARNIAIALFTPDIDGKYTDALTNYRNLRI